MLNHTITRKVIGIMTPKITALTVSKRSAMIQYVPQRRRKAASWATLDELCGAIGLMLSCDALPII
jgi:hypothetical protein